MMTRLMSRGVVVAALLVAAASFRGLAAAQNGSADALTGIVTSKAEGPMEGVIVIATRSGSTVLTSVTTDETNRMAAVISGPVVMHTYLVAHVASSTISELTLWSSGPPQVPWPSMADNQELDSMTAPLCEAYIASCP